MLLSTQTLRNMHELGADVLLRLDKLLDVQNETDTLLQQGGAALSEVSVCL